MTSRSDNTLKSSILKAYHADPNISRRAIAVLTGASYGTVRNVISRFNKVQVTTRGSPKPPYSAGGVAGGRGLPFSFHGWFWSGSWPSDLYEKCPLSVGGNRNGQKRFAGSAFRFVLHKGGKVFVYPRHGLPAEQWRVSLLEWLQSWVHPRRAVALIGEANLRRVGAKSYAVHAPGVPQRINVRLKGIGSFKSDRTPFPDGTLEYEVDPLLDKRLRKIESTIESLAGRIVVVFNDVNKLLVSLDNLVGNEQNHVKPDSGLGRV